MKLLLPLVLLVASLTQVIEEGEWSRVRPSEGKAHRRHEHAFVEVEKRFYALGGRKIQPVDIFDPKSKRWSQGQEPPFEIHHFQAVAWEGEALIAGAFTGKYPHEKPVKEIYFYSPKEDTWRKGPEIPKGRRRGSAGAFLKDGKLYLVCGLTGGASLGMGALV